MSARVADASLRHSSFDVPSPQRADHRATLAPGIPSPLVGEGGRRPDEGASANVNPLASTVIPGRSPDGAERKGIHLPPSEPKRPMGPILALRPPGATPERAGASSLLPSPEKVARAAG